MKQEPKTSPAPIKKAGASPKSVDRHTLVAVHYGFSPIEPPKITKEDTQKWKGFKDPFVDQTLSHKESPFCFDVAEKAAILRTYIEDKWDTLPHPMAFCFKKPLPGSDWKRPQDFLLGLEILGFSGSTAEALILRTALSMLEDEGFTDLEISWNSIGDKDSVQDYERMLGNYIRKNSQLMPADLRKEIRESVFNIARTKDSAFEKWRMEAPKSMSFLGESSRCHVKEVLEYIESFDIPYSINPTLIGCPEFTSHIVFEIRSSGETLAQGYRYGRLSKRLGFKKELPAIGATISFKKKEKNGPLKPIPKPKFYLVQLGFGAKIQTLKTLEVLRKAKIAVGHSLTKDKMQSQMGTAENLKVPYMLLVGQKEAFEKSVVIRDMNTRVQETVSLTDLPNYIKKLP